LHAEKGVSSAHTKTLGKSTREFVRGTTFAGRYEIIEELGKGGMGSVYRVEDKRVREEVALKLIRPEVAADEGTIERFRNELKFTRRIAHRNVCKMYDLGENEGLFYITMEYVPGEDLKTMIRMTGQLGLGTALRIAKQVGEGLAEAHKAGVIHRDLKPGNIMIGKDGNARIMDFGIARSVKGKGLTGTNVLIGTPEYMSLEQVEGQEVDARSDIYSLGIVLYEMLTGKVPFEAPTPLAIAMKHKTESPVDPANLNIQIPVELSRAILKCLQKSPEKRYQTAEAFLKDLESIEQNRALPHAPPSWATSSPDRGSTPYPKWKNSIAVLPFADLSPQKDQDYFCDGLADELINALTKIMHLKVAARTSAFSFKGKSGAVREIGETLGVSTVLEGSVRKAENKVRITAQLVNVADGYHLWSEKYDRDLDDIFAIQDEITMAIVEKLEVELHGDEKGKLLKRTTDNPDAYNLYLKGRYFWNRRYEGGLQKGLEYFHQAIAQDPLYASAYVGIADSLNILGTYGLIPPREAFTKAKAALQKAMGIDDTLPEIYASLGYIGLFHDWDRLQTESNFKKALELNPNDAMAQIWYSLSLAFDGRFDEAIRESKKAYNMEPLSLIINALYAGNYYLALRHDEALAHFAKTIELDPNFSLTYLYQSGSFLAKRRFEEAIATHQKLVALTGNAPFGYGYLGFDYGYSGRKAEALEALNRLEEFSKVRYVSPFYKALIYDGLGDKDKALDSLDRAYEEREPFLALLKVWPWPFFEIIRTDQRFVELLRKIGFESEEKNG
jgi:serine/threonine-protein kinase